MCNKETSIPPFPVILLGFSLTALLSFILGQIRTVCLAAALVLAVVKLKLTSYQAFLDDIIYSTAFGTFIGSTLGQVYKEETVSWIMLTIFFILVWWTKESKSEAQNSEVVKWYTVCWATVEILCAIIRVESYLLKVLLTTAISGCVTYCVLQGMKKTYEEVLTYTVYVSGGTAALGLFIWWLINLCCGRGLLPEDDVNSYAFVIVVILLMFSMKIFGLRDEYLDEVFQMCFMAVLIILPNLIAVLVHPILLVLMFAVAATIFGYMYYFKQKAVNADGKLKNTIEDYVLGPLYLSIAMGLMVWIFKHWMEVGGSDLKGLMEVEDSNMQGLMGSGDSDMQGLLGSGDSNIEELMEAGDSDNGVKTSGASGPLPFQFFLFTLLHIFCFRYFVIRK